tara:strand:+ start:452 stop:1228 length:777 start_codon:yes stop_codon:yes gene_type:complete
MGSSLLNTQGLTVKFGGLTALSDLNFSLEKGELLGLIGPNGSGKTTCFNTITGIYRQAAGTFSLLGEDITGFTPQQIYKCGITRTFQRLRLAVGLSVFDNLLIGDSGSLNTNLFFNLFQRNRLKQEIEKKINKVKNIISVFNPTLVDKLYEPVSKLSMIDRRRIEVCRALISDPKVLLLDEPSAGMTQEETRDFMNDLDEIKAKSPDLGIILIEHEMNVIESVTDRCIVLSYGKKISEGSFKDVSRNPNVRTAYLGED